MRIVRYSYGYKLEHLKLPRYEGNYLLIKKLIIEKSKSLNQKSFNTLKKYETRNKKVKKIRTQVVVSHENVMQLQDLIRCDRVFCNKGEREE